MKVAQDAEDLFGLGDLREGREPAQVAEDDSDLAPMARQEGFPVGARDQGGDLGRNEPCQLAPLPLDGGQ